jgi:uncharacterized protein with GYD domain
VPTCIMLANFTEQGIRNLRGGAQRRAAALKRLERLGGRERSVYYTQGRYDLVVTLEFPDDAAATAFLVEIGEVGDLRTETLRAFTPEEMDQIRGKMAPR